MKNKFFFIVLMAAVSVFAQWSNIYISVSGTGKIIDYIDPNDWGKNPLEILSGVNGAYRYMETPRAAKDSIVKILADTVKQKIVDLTALKTLSGDTGLISGFYSKTGTAVILPSKNYLSVIKDGSKVSNPDIKDTKTVSSGSYTVGSGGSYATWAAAVADIANLTGNLTFTQISNVTETANAQGTETLGGYTLTYTSSAHNGNITGGFLISHNSSANAFDIFYNGPGTVNVYNLNWKRIADGSDANRGAILTFGTTTSFTLNIYNTIINGNGYQSGGIALVDADPVVNVWNVLIFGFGTSGSALRQSASNASDKYENITIYNCPVGINNNNLTKTYQSVGLYSCGANFSNNSNSTSTSCGTDAASVGAATNNSASVNLVLANEFVSTTNTSPYFFKVKAGASCDDGGAAPSISGNTTGIRGNARPGDASYSIGADELWIPTFDTSYEDTVTDSTCLSLDSLVQTVSDSMKIDSMNWIDTVLNNSKSKRIVSVDTTEPTLDTATTIGGDSLQLTISACNGDTTNIDTFYVAVADNTTTRKGMFAKQPYKKSVYSQKAIKTDVFKNGAYPWE